MVLSSFWRSLVQGGTSPEQLSATKTSLVQTLCAKINSLSAVDYSKAAVLTTAINNLTAEGGFEDSHRQTMTASLIARVNTESSSRFACTGRKDPQACLFAHKYLTQDDWDALSGNVSMQQRISIIRDAMHRIGVSNPNEQTLKLLTAIALCSGLQHHIPVEQKYDVLKQLKTLFQSFRPQAHLPHLTSYPENPADLERGWWVHAYGSEHGPLPAESPPDHSFAMVARTVPARSSNVHLRGKISCTGQQQAEMNFTQTMTQMLRALQSSSSFGGNPIPRLQVFGQPRRSGSSMESLGTVDSQVQQHALVDRAAGRYGFMQLPPPHTEESLRADPNEAATSPVSDASRRTSPATLPPSEPPLASALVLAAPTLAEAAAADSLLYKNRAGEEELARMQELAAAAGKRRADAAADQDKKTAKAIATKAAADAAKERKAKTAAASGKEAKATASGKEMKATASGKKTKATASDKAMKATASGKETKATAAGKEMKASGGKKRSAFVLGCAKCRGSHGGCSQCRDSAFAGHRYQR